MRSTPRARAVPSRAAKWSRIPGIGSVCVVASVTSRTLAPSTQQSTTVALNSAARSNIVSSSAPPVRLMICAPAFSEARTTDGS